MIYRVVVSYTYFDFEDAEQAMIFAETARRTYVARKPGEDISIEIQFIKREEIF